MSNENTMPEVNANVPTKAEKLTYSFKGYSQEKDKYKELVKLVESGKLSENDIEEIKEEGKPTRYKRKAVTVDAEIPVIEIPGFTAEQNAHVRHLIMKKVEDANKTNIDECSGEFAPWFEVLQSAPTVRGGGTKVTAEMLEAATESLQAFAEENYNDKVAEILATLAGKKFTTAACKDVKLSVLEKFQSVLLEWYEALETAEQLEVDPVMQLWAGNIEKILNPQNEVDIDIFDL